MPRICMTRKITTTATNVPTISFCILQHLLLFELVLLVPPVELFPICISVLDPPPLGGLRKLPAPLGVNPADRFVFRMCSPCSNLGGLRACRELMFASFFCCASRVAVPVQIFVATLTLYFQLVLTDEFLARKQHMDK